MTKAQEIANRDLGGLVKSLRNSLFEKQTSVPDELKSIKAWLVYEVTKIQDNGKFNKIPCYPKSGQRRKGKQGSDADLENLGTWDEATKALLKNSNFAGVGFACLPHFGIVALDLDRCVKEGVVAPWVEPLIADTYCEFSPSGTGLRAFWIGSAKDGKNNETGCELFHSKGFVTVTGDCYIGGAVPTLPEELGIRLEALCQAKGISESTSAKKIFQSNIHINELADYDPRLQAIKLAGFYERDLGGGKHSIKCPFEELHSDLGRSGGDGDTVYFQPHTNGFREGWIHCLHTHPQNQIAYWQKIGYNPPNQLSNALMTIDITTGELIPVELLQTVRIDDVLTQLPPAPSFVWDCYVPRKEVTLFSGHGSVGKSWIALMLAVSGALGRPLFGREVQRSKTIFVSLEDDSDVVRYRLSVICLKWAVSTSSLDGWLWMVDGTQSPELYISIIRNKGELTATYQQLSQKVKEFDAGLVIVDNASDAYGGDEIQRKTVREFIRSLAKIAKSTNGAFVLLAHVDKDTAKGKFINAEGYSGSTAWHNSARSRLLLKRDKDGTLTLEHQKGNHSNGLQEPILLEWLPDELPKLMGDCADLTPLLNGVARGADEGKAKVLLGLIEEFASRGQYCTPNMTSHSKVHKVLRSDPEFKKLKLFPDDTQRIVTQCQRAGWLDIEQYTGTSRNKKEKWVLTETGKAFAGLESVASNALNASNTLINADDGIDAPASNIVGGMGEFTHASDSTHQTSKEVEIVLN